MKNKKTIRWKIYLLIVVICLIASFIVYNALTIDKKYYKNEKDISIPIFVYHDIVATEAEIEYDYMQTTEKRFKQQILGLKALGYHFISYEDLIKYNNGEGKLAKNSCIITFDDGWDGVYQYAYPFAKEYNIPITSFVVNYLVGTKGYFNWNQAKEMQDSGIVEIASHSLDHENFDTKTTEEAVENVRQSFEEIHEKTGGELKVFTYPCGLFTGEQLEKMKEQGYMQNLTDNEINTTANLNLYGLHRCYPLNDSVPEIMIKKIYRQIKYK